MSQLEPLSSPAGARSPLRELAILFLRLGATAFGGPAVHVAMMEDEVVRRRRWLTSEQFLDLLGATNLIPGPNSTEMAIHIGHARAGFPGLLVAGSCFIIPAALITGTMAWLYVRLGTLPEAGGVLYGIKPVIVAVVLQALWALLRKAVKSRTLAVLAAAASAAAALGVNELVLLLVAGVVTAITRRLEASPDQSTGGAAIWIPLAPAGTIVGTAAIASSPFSLSGLFFFFLKVGAVLYGSGYVLLAFLRADLVERWGWLTEAQLIDAVAVGQVTPGPLFTTATFIGFLLGGPTGALLATAGIFLPAFVFVALSGPLIPRLRRSRTAGAFLDGVNVASLALMAVVTAQLARAALVDWPTVGLALLSAVLLLRFKLNTAWLVLGGALAGLAMSF